MIQSLLEALKIHQVWVHVDPLDPGPCRAVRSNSWLVSSPCKPIEFDSYSQIQTHTWLETQNQLNNGNLSTKLEQL
jgi:hypothetical protein